MDIEEKMNKEKNTSFMKNVLMLMISQVLIKILGFVYKMIIINIEGFGDIGNGYYNTGYQVYSLLLTISSVGLPSVISKLVSERVAKGDRKGAHRIFTISLKVFTTIGLVLSLGLFLTAEFIADNIINVPNVKYVLMVLAPAIMFVSASSILRGYFAGLGSMKSSSISQTLEQFFNCVLTITFVYALVGKDAAVMAAGGNLSTTLAIIISFSYLVIFYLNRRKSILKSCEEQEVETENKSSWEFIKTILAISIPMTLGSLISVINSTIDTITISNCVQIAYEGIIEGKEALEANAMRLSGILSKVETIMHLPLAVAGPFCTALVPAISSAMATDEIKLATKRVTFSFFAAVIIILPSAIGIAVLAEPILKMIYPAFSEGALLLQLSMITMVFVALTYVTNGALYGIGKILIPVSSLVIGGLVKFILNIILIRNPNINVYGATISSIACQAIVFVICMIGVNKYIKLDIKLEKHILKPALSAIVMGICVYGIYIVLESGLGNTVATITSISVGAVIYATLLIITKTFSKEDFKMIPYGLKVYCLLERLKIYKEND